MLLDVMPTIESHLSQSRYLAGELFTLADVNAFMLMRGFREAKLNLNDFPSVIKWHDEIAKRPTVKKVFAAWW
jgi:GST-like protein